MKNLIKFVFLLSLIFTTPYHAIRRTSGNTDTQYITKAEAFPHVGLIAGMVGEKGSIGTFTYLGRQGNLGFGVTAAHCCAYNNKFMNLAESKKQMFVTFSPSIRLSYSTNPVVSVIPHPSYPEENISTNPWPDADIALVMIDLTSMTEEELETLDQHANPLPSRQNPIGNLYANIVGYGVSGDARDEDNTSGTKRAMDATCLRENEYIKYPIAANPQTHKDFTEMMASGTLPADYPLLTGDATSFGDSGGPIINVLTNELDAIVSTRDNINCNYEPTIVHKRWYNYYLNNPTKFKDLITWEGSGNDNRFENFDNWSGDFLPGAFYTLYGFFNPQVKMDNAGAVSVSERNFLHTLSLLGQNTLSFSGNNEAQIYSEYLDANNATFEEAVGNCNCCYNCHTECTNSNCKARMAANLFTSKGEVNINCGAKFKKHQHLDETCTTNFNRHLRFLGNGELELAGGVVNAPTISFEEDLNRYADYYRNQLYPNNPVYGMTNIGKIMGHGTVNITKENSSMELTKAYFQPKGGELILNHNSISLGNSSYISATYEDDALPCLKAPGALSLAGTLLGFAIGQNVSDEALNWHTIISAGNHLRTDYLDLYIAGDYTGVRNKFKVGDYYVYVGINSNGVQAKLEPIAGVTSAEVQSLADKVVQGLPTEYNRCHVEVDEGLLGN